MMKTFTEGEFILVYYVITEHILKLFNWEDAHFRYSYIMIIIISVLFTPPPFCLYKTKYLSMSFTSLHLHSSSCLFGETN